ncbi:MAG: hypothetical protein ACJATP_002093, partial [Candidatus Azotimanducaceae bacterium]
QASNLGVGGSNPSGCTSFYLQKGFASVGGLCAPVRIPLGAPVFIDLHAIRDVGRVTK